MKMQQYLNPCVQEWFEQHVAADSSAARSLLVVAVFSVLPTGVSNFSCNQQLPKKNITEGHKKCILADSELFALKKIKCLLLLNFFRSMASI
jgi:hypothetical protein